jgi:hypothetical protein
MKLQATDLKFGQTIQYVDMANPNTKYKVLGATKKYLYARGLETNFLERIELHNTFVENKSLTDGFNRWCLA